MNLQRGNCGDDGGYDGDDDDGRHHVDDHHEDDHHEDDGDDADHHVRQSSCRRLSNADFTAMHWH